MCCGHKRSNLRKRTSSDASSQENIRGTTNRNGPPSLLWLCWGFCRRSPPETGSWLDLWSARDGFIRFRALLETRVFCSPLPRPTTHRTGYIWYRRNSEVKQRISLYKQKDTVLTPRSTGNTLAVSRECVSNRCFYFCKLCKKKKNTWPQACICQLHKFHKSGFKAWQRFHIFLRQVTPEPRKEKEKKMTTATEKKIPNIGNSVQL